MNKIFSVTTILIIVTGFAVCIYFFYLCINALIIPIPMDYGEGPLLAQAIDISNKIDIFSYDLGSFPWRVSNYPPIFSYVWSNLLGDNPHYFYPAGRLISVLSAVGTAFFVYLILTSSGIPLKNALLGPLIFISSAPVLSWGYLARVDLLALFFSSAAIYSALRASSFYNFLFVVLLSACSLFTRQSTVVTLIPVVMYIFLSRSGFRVTIRLLLCITALTSLFLFTTLTKGFFSHVIFANANPLDLNRLKPLIIVTLTLFPITVYTFLDRCMYRFSWMLIINLFAIVNIFLALKIGASVNYLLPIAFGNSLSIVILLLNASKAIKTSIAVACLLLIGLNSYLGINQSRARLEHDLKISSQSYNLMLKALGDSKSIISTDFPGIQLLANKPLVWQGFETLILSNRLEIIKKLEDFLKRDGAWIIISKYKSNRWPREIELSKIASCIHISDTETLDLYRCSGQT